MIAAIVAVFLDTVAGPPSILSSHPVDHCHFYLLHLRPPHPSPAIIFFSTSFPLWSHTAAAHPLCLCSPNLTLPLCSPLALYAAATGPSLASCRCRQSLYGPSSSRSPDHPSLDPPATRSPIAATCRCLSSHCPNLPSSFISWPSSSSLPSLAIDLPFSDLRSKIFRSLPFLGSSIEDLPPFFHALPPLLPEPPLTDVDASTPRSTGPEITDGPTSLVAILQPPSS